MKKLSVIRGKDVAKCPYGLPILEACESVGKSIFQMTVAELVENEYIDETLKNNKILYLTQKTKQQCPFANSIMEKYNKVDCSYGDAGAGEGSGYLPASPFAPSIFISNRPDTPNQQQPIYDPRLFFEAPNRGIDVPFGMYSIFSSQFNEDALLKLADIKTTNNSVNIKNKIALLKNKYFDILKIIIRKAAVIELNNTDLEKMLIIINDWA